MDLKIKAFSAMCALRIFTINSIDAYSDDFVDQYDHSPGTAGEWECGDMRADVLPPSNGVLAKYGITLEEYQDIAEKVASAVSFGSCGLCV